jgi:tetratricopeptide (TPR) repeat protein
MGTLLWVNSHPPGATKPVSAVTAANPADTHPDSVAATGEGHTPPAGLTAGMTPAQSALALGNWYYDHKAWTQSTENYRLAITLGLDNPDVRTDLGSAYRFAGSPDKALQEYRIAQKQDPRHAPSLFNIGSLYAFDLQQPEKAVATWREYLKRFPTGEQTDQVRHLLEDATKHAP